MIVIISEVKLKPQYREEALKMANKHVELSREEPGCLSHQYYVDCCDENTIFFFEEWQDQQAIDAHFQKDYSIDLSKNFKKWAESDIVIKFYKVDSVTSMPLVIERG